MTPLQSNFAVNNVVLIKGAPKQAGMIEILKEYISFQEEVIVSRTQYDLKKAEERAHILEGLRIAVDNLDAIIHTIRNSRDAAEAMPRLMEGFGLSEIQAKAILDMQFRRLTGLEREKIENEYQELLIKIADFRDILANHSRVEAILKEELTVIRNKYGDERRSEIIDATADMEDEDLIPVDDVIITLSENGYIKRIPRSTYKVQNRGGKGIKGMTLNEDDVIDQFVGMSTHDYVLFFTNRGRVFRLRGFNVPEYSRTSKGIPVVNLLRLDKEEKIRAIVPYSKDDTAHGLFFVTSNGLVKKVKVEEFENIRVNGKIAITLREGDELAFVKATSGDANIIIAVDNGKAVRFHESGIRPSGRTAMGVKGVNTDGGKVIGMATSEEGQQILTVTENGYGKKSDLQEYRMTNRGSKGVKAMNITDKTGNLVCLKAVNGSEDCMIMTDDGIIIRISLNQVSSLGRNSQGVRVIKTAEGSRVSTVAIVDPDSEEDGPEEPAETGESSPAEPMSQEETAADNTANSEEVAE